MSSSVLKQMFAGAGSQLPIVGGVFDAYGKASASEDDFQHQKQLMELSNKMTRSNMEYNYQLNRQAERESPLDTMQGLKAAGVNPAFAAGNLSSPVNSPSPAGPVGHANQQSPLDVAALKQSDAQTRLANAQADKLNAETAEIEGQDKQVDKALRSTLQQTMWENSDPEVRSFAKNMLSVTDKFNFGSVEGLNKFIEFMNLDRASKTDIVKQEFQRALYQARLDGDLPWLQSNAEAADFEAASQKLINLTLDTVLKQALADRQELTKEELEAEIQKILAEAEKTHDTDFVALLKDENKSGAVFKILEKVIDGIMIIQALKGGKALVTGTLKHFGKKFAEKVASKEVPTVAEKIAEKVAVKETTPVVQKAAKKIEASFADWQEYNKVKDQLARYYGSRNAENMFRYYTETRKRGDTFFKYLSDHGIMHPDKNGKFSH